MTKGKVTTDHGTIQHWIEQRGGKPARVKSASDSSGGGLLRVDFPTAAGGPTRGDLLGELLRDLRRT